MAALGECIRLFAARVAQGQEQDADGDEGIGKVEDRPAQIPEAEVEKIHHFPKYRRSMMLPTAPPNTRQSARRKNRSFSVRER